MCPPSTTLVVLFCLAVNVNGHVPRTATPTAASSASSAAVTPSFDFNPISEMITCSPAIISWIYEPIEDSASPELQLVVTLIVTNDGVLQSSAPSSVDIGTFSSLTNPARAVPRRPSRRDIITQAITDSIDPSDSPYTWPSVNVTAGWYIIQASLFSLEGGGNSQPFYVGTGTNTSCLGGEVPVTATPSSSSSTHATSSGTSTSTSGAGAPSSSGASLQFKSRSKVDLGAIAGGVIAGVAICVAASVVYCTLKRRRRSRRHSDELPMEYSDELLSEYSPGTPMSGLPGTPSIPGAPFANPASSQSLLPALGATSDPSFGSMAQTGARSQALFRSDQDPIATNEQSHSFANLKRRQREVVDAYEQGINGAPVPIPAPASIQHIDSGLRTLNHAGPVPSELPPVYTPD